MAPPVVHDVIESPGSPLDPATRFSFETRFGRELSHVRVHADDRAAASAKAVGASAYTVGPHVVFGAGSLTPGTAQGRRILAHELTHVLQWLGTAVPSRGALPVGDPNSPHEREASTEAARSTGAVTQQPPGSADASTHTRTPAVVARQRQPQAAQCSIDCTDPQFLALSRPDREAQLNTQCPQGFAASATTFFGQGIPGEIAAALRTRMLASQASAMREMCLNGKDPFAFRLPGPILTYDSHSPAREKAVDIDASGQPYLMHEVTKKIRGDRTSPTVPEADIDKETTPVFNRIAFWAQYRRSIVPGGITTVSRVSGSPSQRQWTNPATGVRQATTTGELYDRLHEESVGMQEYFNLLSRSDDQLAEAIDLFATFFMTPAEMAMATAFGLPVNSSPASVTAFRRRIADDYRLLGGSAGTLTALAGGRQTASTTPPSHVGDRPFKDRRPEQGFLTLPREVIVALTDQGLSWGAIDFAGGSGDVMHIDCRGLPGC